MIEYVLGPKLLLVISLNAKETLNSEDQLRAVEKFPHVVTSPIT